MNLYGPAVPELEPLPECPICGNRADIFYTNADNGIIGCPNCIGAIESWEWEAEQKEAADADYGDRLYQEWRDQQCS